MHFRYYIRLIKAFLLRFKGLLVLSALFGIVLFVALRLLSPALVGKTTIKIAVSGRYNSSELPYRILREIGEGLTVLDESGTPNPALSDEWGSEDKGQTWKFTLKKDLYWQDGTPVNAGSIKYSFEDVDISYPDSQSVVFKLQSPFAPFPTVVSRPTFKKGLLGTGEWKVDRLKLSGDIVEELILKDHDGNSKIYKFYPTEERAKLAFKLGEVDKVEDVIDPTPFDKWPTSTVEREVNFKRYVAVFFNVLDGNLGDKRFRQALSYAINKETLSPNRAISPVSPLSWAFNPQVKTYDYDKERAVELIKEADMTEEFKKNPNLKLVTNPVLLSTAEKIAKDWEAVGVKTTVQVSSILPEEYQAFLVIYDIPNDPDQYATWHSTQTETNISNYTSLRVDKLLQDGRLELDFETRKKIYLDFQRFLLEDAPAVFLYHPTSYNVVRK